MIHEIGVEIQAALASRGCPFAVVDGPEVTTTTTWTRERIVIEEDAEGSDTFAAVRGSHVNPKLRAVRKVAIKLTIYAQEPAPGAMYFEHRRRCEHVLDLLISSLYDVAAKRKNAYELTGGKFTTPDDFKNTDARGGAVYRLSLNFERGVADRAWDGTKQPEATMGDGSGNTIKVKNIDKVSPAPDSPINAVPSDAETAHEDS